MKILIINTVPFTRNGITSVIMNYYRELNNEIKFDFMANSKVSSEYKAEIEKNNSKLYFFKNRKKQPVSYIRYVREVITKEKYDIVHIHGNSSLMSIELFAIGKSAKTIVHGHNVKTDYPLLHKLLYPYFIRNYDFAFAPSVEAGDWLFKNKKYQVIANGIDLEQYKFDGLVRETQREKLGLSNKKIVLNVSNFSPQKKQSLIIELLPKLLEKDNNFHVLFVGDGNDIEKHKHKVKELGVQDSVTFLGSRKDVNQLYSVADYFVFPTHWESLGLVAVEAQVNGLPIAMSDTIPKVVKIHKNAKFLPNNLPDLWLDFLLTERRIESVSFDEFNIFDIKLNAFKLLEMYIKIIKENERNIV